MAVSTTLIRQSFRLSEKSSLVATDFVSVEMTKVQIVRQKFALQKRIPRAVRSLSQVARKCAPKKTVHKSI
jgi:hypothetical protein